MHRVVPLTLVSVLIFVSLGLHGIHTGRFLNDEGLLTHLFASMAGQELLATVFLQKSRPPISILYAPLAALGVRPFLVAHVVVAAGGIAAVGATAARLGHRHPWIPAAVMALSPLYVGAAAAGVSNTDAVALIAIAGWLVSRRRLVWAGLLLGTLVWVRAETALLVALFAGAMLRERRWTALVALAGFGLIYGLAGALYHGDILWMLHYPPALPEPMPGNPYWRSHSGTPSVTSVLGALLAVSPVLPICVLVRWRDLSRWERLGSIFVLAFCTVMLVFPQWRIFNFDLSPRYLLPILPFVALLVGRATQAWDEPERVPFVTGVLGLAGVLAWWATRQGAHGSALIAVGIASVAVALAWGRRRTLAAVALGVLVASGPVGFDDEAKVDRHEMAPHLGELVDRLGELQPGERRPVYTNEPLLAVYLRWSGELPWADVHYMVQADQRYELDTLANPFNGQKEALWAALRHDFYGTPVWPDQLRPDAVPRDAIFAVTKDERLDLVLPPEIWEQRLRVLHPGYGTVVSELAEAGQ